MDECIETTSALNGSGYGSARVDGVRMGAHVAAFIRAYGPVPSGHVVKHACNNRKCIEPTHLSSGTQSSNIQDAVNQGRMPHVTGPCVRWQGENHPASKLRGVDVDVIRQEQANYKYGQDSALARRFDVTPKVIRDIRKGTLWTYHTSD